MVWIVAKLVLNCHVHKARLQKWLEVSVWRQKAWVFNPLMHALLNHYGKRKFNVFFSLQNKNVMIPTQMLHICHHEFRVVF